jgi:hypothetical protein
MRCRTARSLINHLRLATEKTWELPESIVPQISWSRDWYFRGQRNWEWPLIPSAWRPEKQQLLADQGGRQSGAAVREVNRPHLEKQWTDLVEMSDDATVRALRIDRLVDALELAEAEIRAVHDFVLDADYRGFSSPGLDDMFVSKHEIYENFRREFLMDILVGWSFPVWNKPAIAFAQHYGIPTRLTDWTTNPLIAAYFAAEDAVNFDQDPANVGKPRPRYIAVYAINRHVLGMRVQEIPLARSANEFLRAQSGVLLVDTSGDRFFAEHGRYPDLMNTILKDVGPTDNEYFYPRKYLLPTSQCRELLRLLAIEGITRAQLMPTLENVAKSILLRWRILGDSC